MGRDYDLERIDIETEQRIEISKFINDWLQYFHDRNKAQTTATQWALYDFINELNIKIGVEECSRCGNKF